MIILLYLHLLCAFFFVCILTFFKSVAEIKATSTLWSVKINMTTNKSSSVLFYSGQNTNMWD